MNEICKMIRANGFCDIFVNDEIIALGFADTDGQPRPSGYAPGTVIMLGGGYYTITTWDGRRIEIAKGQLISLA